jgi:hypothetical protein
VARSLSIYPKASLDGSTWKLVVKVGDSRFEHLVPAGITAETPLQLLKVVFDLIVEDSDTDSDVDDALFVDDIKSGPGVETVWGNWQTRAEGIITGLDPGYTVDDFWAAWTMGDTQAVRNDANRALVSGPGGIGRGWTITSVHQHEGDGTVTEG